jgi:hypothetical protein
MMGSSRLKDGVTEAARDFDRLVSLLPDVYPTGFPRPLIDRLQPWAKSSARIDPRCDARVVDSPALPLMESWESRMASFRETCLCGSANYKFDVRPGQRTGRRDRPPICRRAHCPDADPGICSTS